ncbi:unnamed protein product [Pocillopora meandrina]|uniref:Ig-like domain-containing protein n=1 Tax=Pocillopora meandrina TaxID=46732 RepID=A0AAU9XUX5_9CNID|nr:unnamed protein product [Pocillopora meandrina]
MLVNYSLGVQEHPNIPPSYKGRVKIEGKATLVIENINPGDNTEFQCELRGGLSSLKSTVQLIVADLEKVNNSINLRKPLYAGLKVASQSDFCEQLCYFYLACDAPQKEKINSTIYFAVILISKNSKSNCFIFLAPTTGLLCYAQVTIINMRKYYIEGSPVTIACKASGIPPPDVAWIRNGVLESSGMKAAFLKFDNINRTDAGQYTCRANNSVEVTSIDKTIVVH